MPPVDREARRAYDAARYRRNADRAKARARAHYERQTAEHRRAVRRSWRARNPDKVRAIRERENRRVRKDVIEGYGGACACCGSVYLPHLTLDHIDGGGADERRVACGRSIYRRLRREGFPPGYQVLCWNCNVAKHHLGECCCQGGAA